MSKDIIPRDSQRRKHGRQVLYRDNGDTMSIEDFKHGQSHGLDEYYVVYGLGDLFYSRHRISNKLFGSELTYKYE